jgi:Alpha-2,8-polysialyltransferase (POLYST)
LRASSTSLARSQDAVFLGQPLVQDSFMTAESYMDYLGRVKKHVAPRRLVYVPHPRERKGSIERVQAQLGVEVLALEVPVEYHFATESRPACVVSFFCSALESCTRILGDALSAKAVYIEPGDLLRQQDEIEKIYQYFRNRRSHGLEVIRV